MRQRMLLVLSGIGLVVASFPPAAYLAAESWSPGRLGFGLLLALPGLGLLAMATSLVRPLWLTPLVPLGVGLLGLDVTDSAREVVVNVGYAFAVVGALATLGAAVLLRRRTATAASRCSHG